MSEGDTDSKITTKKPKQWLALNGCWYLDCCLNLAQKLEVVDALSHLGYSKDFIKIAKCFVEGMVDDNYLGRLTTIILAG